MAMTKEMVDEGRRQSSSRDQITHQLRKYFARRSGVLLTDTSLQKLSSIIYNQLESENGPAAVERMIDALKRENNGYSNEQFPE